MLKEHDQLVDKPWIGWCQEWSFKRHQPSGFSQSRVYVLVNSSFHLGRGRGGGLLPVKQVRNVPQAFVQIFQGSGSLVVLLWGRSTGYIVTSSPTQQLFFPSTFSHFQCTHIVRI